MKKKRGQALQLTTNNCFRLLMLLVLAHQIFTSLDNGNPMDYS